MPLPTLLDIAKINGATDGFVELADEVARVVPEISGMAYAGNKVVRIGNVGASRSIAGTQYKTLVRTGKPTFAFRDAGAGVAPSKSSYENRLVECFIANVRWHADKAVADACEDGAPAYIAEEARAVLISTFMGLGAQFYYGRNTGGDAKGHPGLIDSVDSTLLVDATGTTASTGSSLYAVTWGPTAVQWVLGANGQLKVDDVRIETIVDPADSTKYLTAYIQEMLAWCGVQVKHKFAVGRIKNLTADAGKGLTDALIGSLMSKLPIGYVPDALFCSRRSREQLRASRTATTTSGKEADIPMDWQGIPIIATDSLLDTETIV